MGVYWSIILGANVQPDDLAEVLKEMGARRQDTFRQWWIAREIPQGGLWLIDQDPSMEGYLDDATTQLVTQKLGCPPQTCYEFQVATFVWQGELVAYELAHRCAQRWPCVLYDNGRTVWSAAEIAALAAEEKRLFLDIVFPDTAPRGQVEAILNGMAGWWDTIQPADRTWDEACIEGLNRLLACQGLMGFELCVEAESNLTDRVIATLQRLREISPFLVVNRMDPRALTPEEWVDGLRRGMGKGPGGRALVNAVPTSIDDFVPSGAEAGTGLALEDEQGRLLFFLAGQKHNCPPGESFFAGIGGHLEPGESWPECARREALEEIGAEAVLLSAPETWMLTPLGEPLVFSLTDEPRPLALYEMIHPPGTRRAGQVYRLVIYRGRLKPGALSLDPAEVGGVIALTWEQLQRSLEARLTLAEVALVVGAASPDTRIYPIGTAQALARLLQAGVTV